MPAYSALRGLLLGALLGLLVVPAAQRAVAQAPSRHHLPIITGTRQSSMDAPETNSDLEKYAHSPAVAKFSRALGMSPATGGKVFEDFNSGLLIAVILFYVFRLVPPKLRARKAKLARELNEAREASEEARTRLKQIEDRLSALGGEVSALRRQAAEMSKADEAKIHAAQEEERQRILRSAEAEIAAAQASAERGLKRFASDLAVQRAAARVRLSPEGDQALIDEFLQGLAGALSREGKN